MNVARKGLKVCKRCHELWMPVEITHRRVCDGCRAEMLVSPKACTKCLQVKSLDAYYVCRTDYTGRQPVCIDCMRERERVAYRSRIGHTPRAWRRRLHEPLPVTEDTPDTHMRREPGEQRLHCSKRNDCLSVPARKQWWHCSCPAECEHYEPMSHEQEAQDDEVLVALAEVIVRDHRRVRQ